MCVLLTTSLYFVLFPQAATETAATQLATANQSIAGANAEHEPLQATQAATVKVATTQLDKSTKPVKKVKVREIIKGSYLV